MPPSPASMPEIQEPELYRDLFSSRTRGPALSALREQAMTRFGALGFPTLHNEAWRHTNVAAIAATRFSRPPQRAAAAIGSEHEGYLYDGCMAAVFVDGRFVAEASRLDGLPSGVRLVSLGRGAVEDGELAELGRHAAFAEHAFAALNTALFEDGALVVIEPNVVLEQPLQILYFTTRHDEPRAIFPRTLVIAGRTSEATVIESYAGADGEPTLTCAVTEVLAAESAVLRHYRVQQEATSAFHVAVQKLRAERAANVVSLSLSFGAALARVDINAGLVGEGVDCTLDGLYLAAGRQHVDHQMLVEHAAPHCASHELYKGVLDDEARAVFSGRIHVHPGAQKTDAKQTNRNLLLSQHALVQSNPQLEIFADDVKCTHGSTIGQLDRDALFYMRARGIDEEAARGLLTHAFAGEVLERIAFAPLREDLENCLLARLPGGEAIRRAS